MREFLQCHRDDIDNTEKIKYLSKSIRFGATQMRNETPKAKKRARIDAFAFPAHVSTPSTSATAMKQAKANDEVANISASEHDSSTSASEY